MRAFLLLFIIMPVLEMWLLIKVGGVIGATSTILLVLATAAIGFAMLRRQGFATLFSARQRLEAGELPAEEIIAGLILAVSGALLLTPGFVTDAIGFAGLLPALRNRLIKRLIARADIVQFSMRSSVDGRPGRGMHDDDVIEGEFWRDDKNLP